MRKLILAIIAIVCVDIGIVYMSMDQPADRPDGDSPVDQRYPATNSAHHSTEPPQTSGDLTVADTTVVEKQVAAKRPDPALRDRPRFNRIGRSMIERRSYIAKLRVRSVKKDSTPAARVGPMYAPVVFVVPKPSMAKMEQEFAFKEPIGPRSYLPQSTARNSQRPENRSFIARVLPIIRKPYDWIKAIGSKLN